VGNAHQPCSPQIRQLERSHRPPARNPAPTAFARNGITPLKNLAAFAETFYKSTVL
jgi:hypothetical protein